MHEVEVLSLMSRNLSFNLSQLFASIHYHNTKIYSDSMIVPHG